MTQSLKNESKAVEVLSPLTNNIIIGRSSCSLPFFISFCFYLLLVIESGPAPATQEKAVEENRGAAVAGAS
jgi:hypothetical protein